MKCKPDWKLHQQQEVLAQAPRKLTACGAFTDSKRELHNIFSLLMRTLLTFSCLSCRFQFTMFYINNCVWISRLFHSTRLFHSISSGFTMDFWILDGCLDSRWIVGFATRASLVLCCWTVDRHWARFAVKKRPSP